MWLCDSENLIILPGAPPTDNFTQQINRFRLLKVTGALPVPTYPHPSPDGSRGYLKARLQNGKHIYPLGESAPPSPVPFSPRHLHTDAHGTETFFIFIPRINTGINLPATIYHLPVPLHGPGLPGTYRRAFGRPLGEAAGATAQRKPAAEGIGTYPRWKWRSSNPGGDPKEIMLVMSCNYVFESLNNQQGT